MSETTAEYNTKTNSVVYPESTVRSVAEQLWWHKVPIQTIVKRTHLSGKPLTEKQVRDLQGTDAYREYVVQIMFERRSAEEFEKWVRSYDKYGGIEAAFGERMGLKPEVVLEMVTRVRQGRDSTQT